MLPKGSLWFLVVGFCYCSATALGEPVTLDKPLYAEVFLKSAPARANKLSGNLVAYDETSFTIRSGKEDKSIAWADITPTSAFTLRQRVTDKQSAIALLDLGRFGWQLGAKDQAQAVLKSAVKIDPALKPRVDEILSSTVAAEKSPEKSPGSLMEPAPKPDEPAPIAQPGRKPAERIKYQPATPAQTAEAMRLAREHAKKVSDQVAVKFAEVETDHFLIFTDWDPREQAFLKKNLEEAYKVVSRQFEMSPKDNVFVGKLPVYMFANYKDFAKAAQQLDGFPVTSSVAGYYRGEDTGHGHLSMWKPNESLTGSNNIREAERLWAYVLVHEFTHAFLARYRSNDFIPRWLNEGIAEVIASSQFPYPERRRMAKNVAFETSDLSFLFDDENMPSGRYYPVMHTMVEMLVKSDRKKFLALIDAIKDGEKPEEALKKQFNTNYEGLARGWREWAKNQTFSD
ncbi:MAG: hypothetical protein H7144_13855 [Burkholderiales bacterium]|nr:hypothetical protein [Phycisphaerae bacterium]